MFWYQEVLEEDSPPGPPPASCWGLREVVARVAPWPGWGWPWQAWWWPALLRSGGHPDLPPRPHSRLWLPPAPTCRGEEQWRVWGGGATASISTPFIFISFLYFILRFWNQILICLSDRLSMLAISIRLKENCWLKWSEMSALHFPLSGKLFSNGAC